MAAKTYEESRWRSACHYTAVASIDQLPVEVNRDLNQDVEDLKQDGGDWATRPSHTAATSASGLVVRRDRSDHCGCRIGSSRLPVAGAQLEHTAGALRRAPDGGRAGPILWEKQGGGEAERGECKSVVAHIVPRGRGPRSQKRNHDTFT